MEDVDSTHLIEGRGKLRVLVDTVKAVWAP
jgi:hypothetical protein